jgi:5-methylcytosine-specific restriction endonuclease McrA
VKRQGVDRNLVENDGELRCEYCNQSIQLADKSQRGVTPPDNDLAYDHFVPVARGGKGILANLVIACRACNGDKSDQDPLAWLWSRIQAENPEP